MLIKEVFTWLIGALEEVTEAVFGKSKQSSKKNKNSQQLCFPVAVTYCVAVIYNTLKGLLFV